MRPDPVSALARRGHASLSVAISKLRSCGSVAGSRGRRDGRSHDLRVLPTTLTPTRRADFPHLNAMHSQYWITPNQRPAIHIGGSQLTSRNASNHLCISHCRFCSNSRQPLTVRAYRHFGHRYILTLSKGSRSQRTSDRFSRMISARKSMSA
jgi:hypothetical protein